jgi:type IV pilus secretin PilQ/predicted competence protein
MRFRYRKLLVLCAAMALAIIAPLVASGDRADVAMLKKIASRVTDRTGVITIEASDPVPYVASQPDPHTFVVELRDVVALGFADGFSTDPRHTVSAVQVETGQAFDGATVARIRMTLSQAMRPRVRSSRNIIYVETDRLDRVTGAGAISTAGPASAIRDLRVTRRGEATAVTFRGSGRLMPSGVESPKEGPPRLVIDLPNSTSALPGVTPVAQGPVDKVRIGLNEQSPLVTRVTVDLTRQAPYRLESSVDGQDLTVVFDPPSPLRGFGEASPALGSALPAAPQAPAARVAQAQVPPAQAPIQAPAPPTQVAPAPPALGQQPPVTQPPTAAQGQPTRYTGVPVSLDFQGADLRAVLRTFAEISGLNIVIDPTIQGTVDVALRDVPWDQALDIILRANKLGYSVDGTIVRIAPLSVLAAEQEEQRKLQDAQALAGDLQVFTRSLSYARAEDLRPLITATVLSQRGSIQTDVRTNTVIINDLPDRLARAAALITTLDRPEPQVEIEARIVQTTREFARTVGVQWGVAGRATNALGNQIPLAFPNQGSISGRTGATQGIANDNFDSPGTAVNLGVTNATTGIGLALGSINGAVNLDVALSALERQGQGRLLSTPRVSTQNNVEAEITQGVQIPIQTVANNTVTVTFKDAALTLRVTPQITAASTVIMRISLENASPDFSRSVNNIPPIDTQRAVTQVLVNNGDTTVIGGIYVSREQAAQDRTPGLYRLPLLGWLFKRDSITDESRELLIFITPRIISL